MRFRAKIARPTIANREREGVVPASIEKGRNSGLSPGVVQPTLAPRQLVNQIEGVWAELLSLLCHMLIGQGVDVCAREVAQAGRILFHLEWTAGGRIYASGS